MGFLMVRIPLLLISLPLLGLPLVGDLAWPMFNGCLYAWELTDNFLPLIQATNCCSQYEHVKRNFGSYFAFGFVAMLLELVPFINLAFVAGNAYGAALLFISFLDDP